MSDFKEIVEVFQANIQNQEDAFLQATAFWKEENQRQREHELALAKITAKPQQSSPTQSQSVVGIAPDSATKSSPRSEMQKFEGLIENLQKQGCEIFAGSEDIIPSSDIIRRLQTSEPMNSLAQIASVFKMDSTLTDTDHSMFGIIHHSHELCIQGETAYQTRFNTLNKDNKFLISTCNDNSGVPLFMMHDGRKFSLTGKADNLSIIRPMFIEFKGEKHEGLRKKSGEFTSNDWDVIGQCVARVYATSCVFGFFSNILAIGVCWDKCFLIHLKKTSKDLTTLNIIYFVPDLMSEVWTLFSKQAYENRSITYVNEEDTKLLIQSLHALVPYSPFYCRSQWIGSSMHNVYAITLPQLLRSSTDKRLTFAVSKNLKHFAMKIIPDQKLFDNEVKCLEKINSYIQENSDKVEFTCTFYALGCKKRNEKEVQSFSLEAQSNFQTYRTLIPPLIKPKISLYEQLPYKPWWMYIPENTPSSSSSLTSTKTTTIDATEPSSSSTSPSSSGGGVIFMKCGEYKLAGKKFYIRQNLDSVLEDVHIWLRTIHAAGALHRDLRIRNIIKFTDFPPYVQRDDDVRQLEALKALSISGRNRGEWQIIDFNISSSDATKDNEQEIQRESGQAKHAGWRVQSQFPEDAVSAKVLWSKEDDYEMLSRFISEVFLDEN